MSGKENNIPKNKVLELCEVIRSKHKKGKWPFGIGKMQCWGCWKFGKGIDEEGDIEKEGKYENGTLCDEEIS